METAHLRAVAGSAAWRGCSGPGAGGPGGLLVPPFLSKDDARADVRPDVIVAISRSVRRWEMLAQQPAQETRHLDRLHTP